ncbi:MAG: hypothetical protein R6U98_02975 [Pirellulaceae bacterium]
MYVNLMYVNLMYVSLSKMAPADRFYGQPPRVLVKIGQLLFEEFT